MSALLEMLSPSFLLRDSLYTALIIGFACPLIGVYFLLRRMVFLGVALPQVSAAGIAFAFLAYGLLNAGHQHGDISERLLAMTGSITFTFIALLVLTVLEGSKIYSVEARMGCTYAIAAAVTILLLALDPHGEAQMVNILKGDILAANLTTLVVSAVTFGIVACFVLVFRRQLLLVSFDRDLAQVFRLNLRLWDALLYLGIGLTIAVGVMATGPLVIFGYLILPAVAARAITKHMLSFSLVSSLLGGFAAFWGFYISYAFDFPLGPAEVTFAFLVLCAVFLGRGIAKRCCT